MKDVKLVTMTQYPRQEKNGSTDACIGRVHAMVVISLS